MRSRIQIGYFGLFSAFFLLCFSACENKMEEVQDLSEKLEHLVETAKEVEIFYSESADVKVRLQAPVLLRHKTDDPYAEFPDGVNVTFFDDSLKVGSVMTAGYGVRREKQQLTSVQRNVVWENKRKMERLETEELVWDEKNKKIKTDKFVKVTTDSEIIMSEGLVAEQDFSSYEFLNVTGRIQVDEDRYGDY